MITKSYRLSTGLEHRLSLSYAIENSFTQRLHAPLLTSQELFFTHSSGRYESPPHYVSRSIRVLKQLIILKSINKK